MADSRDIIVSVNVIREPRGTVVQTQLIRNEPPYVKAGIVKSIIAHEPNKEFSFVEADWTLDAGQYVLEVAHTLNCRVIAKVFYSDGFEVLCDFNNLLTNKVYLYSDIPFNGYILLT